MNGLSHSCPVCGQDEFSQQGSYEICDVCGWEDDPVQLANPNYQGGANRESLNQARVEWSNRLEGMNK
jgi:hypothetical protein